MRDVSKFGCGLALLAIVACGGKNSAHHVTLKNGLADVPDVDPQIPTFGAATPVDNPSAPAGKHVSWTAAPVLDNVQVAAARDSVIVAVPVTAGAADFRVFVLNDGVAVTTAGSGESVSNGDIFCAGNQQSNDVASAAPVPMQQIEVLNITGKTRLVIEAIDRNCPFTGIKATQHYQAALNCADIAQQDCVPITMFTESEILSKYSNSVIFNGHGPGATLGAPAVNSNPSVLARTTIDVSPLGTGTPELAYFDDFKDNTDQPVFVSTLPIFSDRGSDAQLLQNSRWDFYQYNFQHTDQVINRGALQMVEVDKDQQVFASNFLVPRRAVQLSDTDYLHVTYTVNSDATQRRYWWMFLCGAAQAGKTIDSEGKIMGSIYNTPFFYQPDGRDPSVEGWNCLQVFPRDGLPFPLPPSNTRPQSDIRVMINQPNVGGTYRGSVVDVSPDQYASVGDTGVAASVNGGWYRQQDGQGTLVAPILDDQMQISPRTRYDMYVRRDRVILFVNGQQRLCNDFSKNRLSMAEAALGMGQVLYHSTAERNEFSSPTDVRTGQRYYLTNTPYADVRSWDNVGYMEHTHAPSAFNASVCYSYP